MNVEYNNITNTNKIRFAPDIFTFLRELTRASKDLRIIV